MRTQNKVFLGILLVSIPMLVSFIMWKRDHGRFFFKKKHHCYKTEAHVRYSEVKEPQMVVAQEEVRSIEYTNVDRPAEFTGGNEAMVRYITSELTYPTKAKENAIQGNVFVSFVVATDGEISKVTLIKGIDTACNKEALRVVKNMPRWSPAVKNGVSVESSMTLPIKFSLQ